MTDREPVATLAALDAQERDLAFDAFGPDDAWELGAWIRATARERGLAVTTSVRLGEQRVFHAALAGTAALNDAWLERKFRVVAHYGRSSLAVRYAAIAEGTTFEESSLLDPRRYAAAGGAFPLRVAGALIGAVGVSGLEMHDDHDLVVEALRAQVTARRA